MCTILRLALEHKTPVSTATLTLPEKVPLSGILNNTCQLVGTPVRCGRVVLLVCKIIIICTLDKGVKKDILQDILVYSSYIIIFVIMLSGSFI